jgi:hypothetical protein
VKARDAYSTQQRKTPAQSQRPEVNGLEVKVNRSEVKHHCTMGQNVLL